MRDYQSILAHGTPLPRQIMIKYMIPLVWLLAAELEITLIHRRYVLQHELLEAHDIDA